MDLKELMAISGYPGLFRFISQGRNGIIVESLEDKKRMNVYSTAKVSNLEEIAVFTGVEEIPLADVFKKMFSYSGGKEALSSKSPNEEIKSYFEKAHPEYNREKVYVSDMKKIINWYNILVRHGLICSESLENNEESTEDNSSGNLQQPAED